ncbi:MAG: hydratase, partial [Lachnospiraceae bacterium]|nr:hydratase [Lachnospiraceae bacterium]
MIKLHEGGAYLVNGVDIVSEADGKAKNYDASEAKKGTIAYNILKAHNTSGDMNKLKIKFDKLTSHDITFVGIIQTARASGLTKFPIPYVL